MSECPVCEHDGPHSRFAGRQNLFTCELWKASFATGSAADVRTKSVVDEHSRVGNAALLCGRHHTVVHRDRLAGHVTSEGVRWDREPGSYERAVASYRRRR